MDPTPIKPTGGLRDIVPPVRQQLEALLAQAEAWGMEPRVLSAGRTCAEQRALHDSGRGVTQADLCRSAHVMGHAVDLRLTPNTFATYERLGQWWESHGGTWGGRWRSFGPQGDRAHYHYLPQQAAAVSQELCPPGLSVEECESLRRRYIEDANRADAEGEEFQAPPQVSSASGMGGLLPLLLVGAGAVWWARRRS